MEYQKQLFHPIKRKEKIIVTWTKGYKTLCIHYRNELIARFDNVNLLLKGQKFHHEMLGDIEIQLLVSPLLLHIKIDGMHVMENYNHPAHTIYSNSLLFGIPATFNLFIANKIYNDSFEMELENIVKVFGYACFISGIIFSACIILIFLKQFQAFIYGIILLLLQGSLVLVLTLFSRELNDNKEFIYLMIAIHFIGSYFSYITYRDYQKHKRQELEISGILDSDL